MEHTHYHWVISYTATNGTGSAGDIDAIVQAVPGMTRQAIYQQATQIVAEKAFGGRRDFVVTGFSLGRNDLTEAL